MSESKLVVWRHYPVYPIAALTDFLCLENQMEIEDRRNRMEEATKLILEFLKPNTCFDIGKTKSIVNIAMLTVNLKSSYYYKEENRHLFHIKYNLIHDIGCVIDYLELMRDYTREQSITHALDVLIHPNRFYFNQAKDVNKLEQVNKDVELFLRSRKPLKEVHSKWPNSSDPYKKRS